VELACGDAVTRVVVALHVVPVVPGLDRAL
jgi:hypothetical protein